MPHPGGVVIDAGSILGRQPAQRCENLRIRFRRIVAKCKRFVDGQRRRSRGLLLAAHNFHTVQNRTINPFDGLFQFLQRRWIEDPQQIAKLEGLVNWLPVRGGIGGVFFAMAAASNRWQCEQAP